MNEIVSRVAAAAGISEDIAEKAVKIIFELVQEHAPKEIAAELFSKLPDGSGVPDAAKDEGGGLMGALGGAMGGLGGLGGAMGAMGALTKMQSAGLSMDQVQTVSKETLAFAREHAGEETVGKIVAAIPGLSQFV